VVTATGGGYVDGKPNPVSVSLSWKLPVPTIAAGGGMERQSPKMPEGMSKLQQAAWKKRAALEERIK
jgi:hypothetical protein